MPHGSASSYIFSFHIEKMWNGGGAGAGTHGRFAHGGHGVSARGRCDVPGRRAAERMATVGGPPWALPVSLLSAASAAQVAGAVALLGSASALAAGAYYGPRQLAAVHLLGLAFLTVAIFGALLQLVPVVMRTALGTPARGAMAGAAVAGGSWALAVGLWADRPVAVATGGTLVVAGGAVLLADLGRAVVSARRAGSLGAAGWGIAVAGVWFAVVLALGAVMAANIVSPFLGADRVHLLVAHAAVAIVGWIGGTIIAVGLKLAPMFALAHGYRRGAGTASMIAWHASVAPITIGLGLGIAPLAATGGIVLLGACVSGLVFTADVARHRRRRPEAPLIHLAVGLTATGAACLIMLTAWAGGGDVVRAAIPAGLLVLVGLGVGVTAGNLFKMVPMLVWTGCFAHRVGMPGTPRLADLYPARLALAEVGAFTAGLGLLVGGVAAHSAAVAQAGAGLLIVSALATAAAVAACVAHAARSASPPPVDDPPVPTPAAAGTTTTEA